MTYTITGYTSDGNNFAEVTTEALSAEVKAMVGDNAELPDEVAAAVGEVCV